MTTTTASERILNFSAGPAVLPEEVLMQAQADLWNIAGSGIGILEHSHRGPVFTKVLEETEADLRRLASIGDEYHVLFLQGGASLQFAMVPMSFLGEGRSADYLDTGSWTKKAIKEAKRFGEVNVAFEGAASGYDHVPQTAEIKLDDDAAYTYYCSNNTIYGTAYRTPPSTGTPLVCDASSDIFSGPVAVAEHALIFAGAQKNLGPAGCTLVIIRKDFAERAADVPSMLDYRQHAEKDSCLNTPPTFGIYVIGQVVKWIERQGGLQEMDRRNETKAAIVYDAIEASGGFYRPVARADSRSRMNVTFRTPDENLDAAFVKEAKSQGLDGLKGHRSVGGLRASIYNAFPQAGCEALAGFMREFARKNG
ncbi:MAG: 3-phosphoserine/phosphohydroxythreonine transaminase [Planctomycetota bacterium]|jgi:phosphoserine aminotransferase